jgi:hypothetical protein
MSGRAALRLLIAGLLVTLGVRYLLGRYQLLLDGFGFGGSIGYTDVHARLPARTGARSAVLRRRGAARVRRAARCGGRRPRPSACSSWRPSAWA